MEEQQGKKDQAEVIKQELEVRGSQLVDRIREIVDEGNARHVIIKREGRTIMEFPLAVGVGGTAAAVLISPMLAALGAVGALVSNVKVIIERTPGKGERTVSEGEEVTPTSGSPTGSA